MQFNTFTKCIHLQNASFRYDIHIVKQQEVVRWLTKFHEPLKGSFQLNLEEICQVFKTGGDEHKKLRILQNRTHQAPTKCRGRNL